MTSLTGETLTRRFSPLAPGDVRRHADDSGAAMDRGICDTGLQPSSTSMRDVLAAQDGLYTLVLRPGDGTWEARVIVSLTMTEGGCNLDADDTRFTGTCAAILISIRERGVRSTLADLDRYAPSFRAGREPSGLERKSP